MLHKCLFVAALAALLATAACDDDAAEPQGAGGTGGVGGSGGAAPGRCDGVTCDAGKSCDERTGDCECACSFAGPNACAAGEQCSTASCSCVEITGQIGSACTASDQCTGSGAACLQPGNNGIDWVGGYCTVACDSSANPCPANSTCTGLGCLANCDTAADCDRTDYSCLDIEDPLDACGLPRTDLTKVCFPTARSDCTPANTGGACADDAGCAPYGVCDGGSCACSPIGGRCLTSRDCVLNGSCVGVERTLDDEGNEASVTEGYCITFGECDPTQPFEGCGANGRCEDGDGTATLGACIPISPCAIAPGTGDDCTSDDDCGTGVCEGGSCTCSPVGGRCTSFEDCLLGGECLDNTGWAGGYCMKWDCDPNAESPCGDFASCLGISFEPDPHAKGIGRTSYACFADCSRSPTGAPDEAPGCRSGYACQPGTLLGGIGDSCENDGDCAGLDFAGMPLTCNQAVCTVGCHAASEDVDCPAGWTCFFEGGAPTRAPGICLPTCSTDAGCNQAAGESCAEIGYQPDWGMPVNSCLEDSECEARAPGSLCRHLSLNQRCTEDAQCPNIAGQQYGCRGGFCTAPTGACIPECDTDADCGVSMSPTDTRRLTCHNGTCNFSICLGTSPDTGYCFPGCDSNGDCEQCELDEDCGNGYVCDTRSGKCEANCACDISADSAALGTTTRCSVGEACNPDGERCQVPCTDEGDCQLGATCESGFCLLVASMCNLSDGNCSAACISDVQCGAGNSCDTASGVCYVACASNADCQSGACDREVGRCTQSCEFTGCAPHELCDPNDHVCYEPCGAAHACPADRICDAGSGLCTFRCETPEGQGSCTGTTICEPETGLCIERCSGASPCDAGICDPESGRCVECLDAATDCEAGQLCVAKSCVVPCDPATNPCGTGVCDETSGLCVACVADGDCANGVCNPATNLCVECVSDGSCAPGVCDPATNSCTGCLDNNDCQGLDVCDPVLHQCVGCTRDGDCPGQRCLIAEARCVDCLGGGDCGAGEVCDPADNACVGCVDAADCAAGLGACVGRTCVQCATDAECAGTPATPACEGNVCVECTAGNSSACGATEVCEVNANNCVDCLSDADCTSPDVCDPANLACVRCLVTGDCAGTDYCDAATNACVFECDPANNTGLGSANTTDCAALGTELCCPGGTNQNRCGALVGGCP